MHALIEPGMGKKPALQPKVAIGPVVRAIAAGILAKARSTILDPEHSNEDAVHQFRRSMKEWRALMRLLAPFVPDAARWRLEARDHARSLAHARDGAAALNAFEGLIDKGVLVLSARSCDTVRSRLEALRGSEEQAVLTAALRDAIVAWIDTGAAAVDAWPLDAVDFAAIAARLTAPHQPLAHWRARLAPACAERTDALAQRAARIAHRLFADRPKAFRHRLEALWHAGA